LILSGINVLVIEKISEKLYEIVKGV
jgi:hypothetical protein